MKFLFKIALIFLIFVTFWSDKVNAIVLDKDYLESKITEDLNNKYKKNNPDGAVIVRNVPIISVNLEGSTLVIDTYCDFTTTGRNKLAKVTLTENGNILRTFVVPIEIKAYDTVLVASRDISRGENLNTSNTKYEKRSIESNTGNVITENFALENLISQRSIKAGEIIDKRFTRKQTAIYRSNPVTAIFQSGGIRLSIEVTAMENGGIGDYIKVRSKEYNKIYQGKIISSNQVLIQIWGI